MPRHARLTPRLTLLCAEAWPGRAPPPEVSPPPAARGGVSLSGLARLRRQCAAHGGASYRALVARPAHIAGPARRRGMDVPDEESGPGTGNSELYALQGVPATPPPARAPRAPCARLLRGGAGAGAPRTARRSRLAPSRARLAMHRARCLVCRRAVTAVRTLAASSAATAAAARRARTRRCRDSPARPLLATPPHPAASVWAGVSWGSRRARGSTVPLPAARHPLHLAPAPA